MKKQLLFGDDARQKMLSGINQVADAVTTTLSPKGRNVAIQRKWGAPLVIHDGVSVAKQIDLVDPFEDMGAQLVKEAASRTNDEAGDGTTTATLLAQKLTQKGMRLVTAGTNPMMMKKGIDNAVTEVVKEIRRLASPVKKGDWKKVATISAQSEVIGEKIAEALNLVGENGVVEIQQGSSADITIDHREGMVFEKGFQSPYFAAGSEDMSVEIEDAYILATDIDINDLRSMEGFFDSFLSVSKNLVIIANEVSQPVLAALVANKLKGVINVVVVKAPSFGDRRKEMLEDIAILTGAEVVSKELGAKLNDIDMTSLGRADSVRVTAEETVIIGGKGEKQDIEARVAQIDAKVKQTSNDFEKEKLLERRAKISGGVAVINVGAASEPEMKNLIERVKDAKEATRAAIEEGIIPGGGVTLVQAVKVLDSLKSTDKDEQAGIDLVKEIAQEPIRMLAENSGVDAGWVASTITQSEDPHFGYNVLTGKFEDMIKAGIIEPAKVATSSLLNAASVASMVLTTECLVAMIEEDKE